MALKDSKKVIVAVKYGGPVAGTDAISISNEDVRLSPVVASGSFKDLVGKLGNKIVWKNIDDVTVSGANVDGYLTGNDETGLALDTPPAWSNLYKICGLDEAIDGVNDTVTYTPGQTQPSDLSEVAVWRDGSKRVLSGALGTLTINAKVGEPITQSVALSGFTDLVSTAEANPSGTPFNEKLLLILKSTDTLTVTGTQYKGTEFSLIQGNDIQKLYAMGTKDYERVDFDSMIEITYLKENEDIYTDFANGTSHNIVAQAGSVNGKAVKITAGQATVEAIEETTVNGKEAVKVKFNLNGDANGINQYSILFGTMA